MDKKDKCYIAAFVIGTIASIAYNIWLLIEAPVLWVWGQILSLFGCILGVNAIDHFLKKEITRANDTRRVMKTIFEDK